jgi:hypothetical protein
MLLTFNEMVELVGPYAAAGCLAEYWATSVEDRHSFYFILFYFILFIFVCLFEFTCGPPRPSSRTTGGPRTTGWETLV